MEKRWTRLTALIAGWAFLGFLLSIEVYFNFRAEMKASAEIDFVEIAIPQFGRAMMWAMIAPFILKLRLRMPLTRPHWARSIVFHLAASFAVMATFYLGRLVSYGIFFIGFDDFWTVAWQGFYGRNIIDMLYYWGVLGFGYSWEIHQRYKTEELKAAQLESRLIETELKALREQLRPHFLFNTLNTVSVLVREGRNDEAVNLIARLSSLLRMTLDSSRNQEVTMQEEVDFLERYVDIQKARFADRLTVHMDIEPVAMNARIPNLLLQPLVENAIVHGIAPKAGAGRVDILGRVEGDQLHLIVSDDGAGIPSGDMPTREGIGLSNTRERIAKLYGNGGQMVLRSAAGCGVTVQIVIPFRR